MSTIYITAFMIADQCEKLKKTIYLNPYAKITVRLVPDITEP